MIDQLLNSLSGMITDNAWLAPVLALMAGVLTSVTPCALSSVPLVIGYVGGSGSSDTKRAFTLSLTFAGGMALTFTALGTAASLFGRLMGSSSRWWYLALGILMVMMALQTWEIFQFIPSTYLTAKNTKRGVYRRFDCRNIGRCFFFPMCNPGSGSPVRYCCPEWKCCMGSPAPVSVFHWA